MEIISLPLPPTLQELAKPGNQARKKLEKYKLLRFTPPIGTVQCPETWTREYYGYIMTERARNRNSYECVDADAEAIPESGGNADGALFYFTEINCHNIYCPPYQQGSELVCVVCTK